MKLKGSITVFVLILLGFIIGLYLMGFSSPFISQFMDESGDELSEDYDTSASNIVKEIFESIAKMFSKDSIGTLGLIVGFSLLTGFIPVAGGGMSYTIGSLVRYLVPALLLYTIVNLFFFPVVPHAEAQGLDWRISMLLSVILNALMFLTIFEFITGKD